MENRFTNGIDCQDCFINKLTTKVSPTWCFLENNLQCQKDHRHGKQYLEETRQQQSQQEVKSRLH